MKKYDKNIFKHSNWIIHNIRKIDSKYIFISILVTIINGIISSISLIVMQEIINGVQLEKT